MSWMLLLSLTALVAVAAIMAPSGRRLKPGIVRMELADPGQAQAILRAWGPAGIAAARVNTRLDFLLIVAYSSTLAALGAETAPAVASAFGWGASGGSWWITIAIGLPLAAGVLDVLENVCMLRTFAESGAGASLARLTRFLARTKFALLLGAGAMMLVGVPAWLSSR